MCAQRQLPLLLNGPLDMNPVEHAVAAAFGAEKVLRR
jgi:hypothetical protein